MIQSNLKLCPACGTSNSFFDNLIWLTTKEAAAYLRITVGSFKNRVWKGEIFPQKFGHHNRFKKNDLDRLIESPSKQGEKQWR